MNFADVEYITVDEAIQANDRVIGLFFLLFLAFVVAVWIGVGIYAGRTEARTRKRIKKAVEKAVEQTAKMCEKASKAAGARTFKMYMDTKTELTRTKQELEDVTNERNAIKGDLDNLRRTAEGCPAYGTAVKKGAFQ